METVENRSESRSRSKWLIAALFAVCAFIVALIVMAIGNAEPRYEGILLSEWTKIYYKSKLSRGSFREAETAIRSIGADGIPHLLNKIESSDPWAKSKLREVLPRRWHQPLGIEGYAYEDGLHAVYGIQALRELAAPALPELERIATEDENDDSRYLAVNSIRWLGSAAEPAIPFLIQCMTNETEMVRHDATIGLGYLQLRPNLVVPALVDQLENGVAERFGDAQIEDVIQSLGWHETNALPEFGRLSTYLDSDSPRIRSAVTNALWRIDPVRSEEMGLVPDWVLRSRADNESE